MNTIDHPERRNLLQIAAKGFYLSLASWRYVRRTFTLPRVLVIGLTFCSLYFLYESAAGASHPLRWREALSGLTTFFLMFLQLRLVDDIADVDVDYPSQTCLKNLRRVRRSLWSGLFLVAGIVVLLNRDWIALAVALLALVFMLATYLGFKTTTSRLAVLGGSRTLPRILLSVAYEIAPFLIFLYVYLSWSAQSNGSVAIPVLLAFTAVFWTGYEFWKYSRFLLPKGTPKRIAAGEPRVVLMTILCVSFVSQLAAYWFARLPSSYPLYASALCIASAAILWRSTLNFGGHAAADLLFKHLGLLFVLALNLGLIAAVMMTRVVDG